MLLWSLQLSLGVSRQHTQLRPYGTIGPSFGRRTPLIDSSSYLAFFTWPVLCKAADFWHPQHFCLALISDFNSTGEVFTALGAGYWVFLNCSWRTSKNCSFNQRRNTLANPEFIPRYLCDWRYYSLGVPERLISALIFLGECHSPLGAGSKQERRRLKNLQATLFPWI